MNEKILESYDITPTTSLIDVLGNAGYSLGDAIADIIDNSITNKATEIRVIFDFNSGDPVIIITDNGIGMNLDKLIEACTPGFKDITEQRESGDLGRYSIGLNAASASMCSQLKIQSASVEDEERNTVLNKFAEMKKSKEWRCNRIACDVEYINHNHGTAVIWEGLNDIASAKSKMNFLKKAEAVEQHLSHVYFDYIKDGGKIYVNGNPVKGWDPMFREHEKTIRAFKDTKEYKNSFITTAIYILPPINNISVSEQEYMRGKGLNEQQGFYIYRENRLIKEGGWLNIDGLTESNKYDYARIRIDIDNALDDYFKPNFLKNEIKIPDDLIDYFKTIAKKARSKSRESYNYMKAPDVANVIKKKDNIPVWNVKNSSNGILLSINGEHPLIKSLVANLSASEQKRLFKLISKSLPLGEISRSGVSNSQNQYLSLKDEMSEMYEQLKSDGLENEEIMKKMATCEPFCLSHEYISELIEFFSEKGVM